MQGQYYDKKLQKYILLIDPIKVKPQIQIFAL